MTGRVRPARRLVEGRRAVVRGPRAYGRAGEIRRRGVAEGWAGWRLVVEIRAGCQVSWLAAHRLARGC
jgi:hypothetical protein